MSCVGQVEQLKQGNLGFDPSSTNFKLTWSPNHHLPWVDFLTSQRTKMKISSYTNVRATNQDDERALRTALSTAVSCVKYMFNGTANHSPCQAKIPHLLKRFWEEKTGKDSSEQQTLALSLSWKQVNSSWCFTLLRVICSPSVCSVPSHHGKTTEHPSHEKTVSGQMYLPSSYQPVQMTIHIPEETHLLRVTRLIPASFLTQGHHPWSNNCLGQKWSLPQPCPLIHSTISPKPFASVSKILSAFPWPPPTMIEAFLSSPLDEWNSTLTALCLHAAYYIKLVMTSAIKRRHQGPSCPTTTFRTLYATLPFPLASSFSFLCRSSKALSFPWAFANVTAAWAHFSHPQPNSWA